MSIDKYFFKKMHKLIVLLNNEVMILKIQGLIINIQRPKAY